MLAPSVSIRAQWRSRAARWAAVWTFLAKMQEEGQQVEKENLELIKVIPKKCFHERIMEQTVNVPVPHVEPTVSSGEVGSFFGP